MRCRDFAFWVKMKEKVFLSANRSPAGISAGIKAQNPYF